MRARALGRICKVIYMFTTGRLTLYTSCHWKNEAVQTCGMVLAPRSLLVSLVSCPHCTCQYKFGTSVILDTYVPSLHHVDEQSALPLEPHPTTHVRRMSFLSSNAARRAFTTTLTHHRCTPALYHSTALRFYCFHDWHLEMILFVSCCERF